MSSGEISLEFVLALSQRCILFVVFTVMRVSGVGAGKIGFCNIGLVKQIESSVFPKKCVHIDIGDCTIFNMIDVLRCFTR